MRVVCTFAAYYAASICLTGGKLIIAAAAIMVAFILECTPAFKRVPITKTLAVMLSFLSLWAVGNVA